MNEARAVLKLRKKLEAFGTVYKISDRYRAGIPDLVCCLEGLFVGIECKIDYNTPTDLQIEELENIDKTKGLSLVYTYKQKTKKHVVTHFTHTDYVLETIEEVVQCILTLTRSLIRRNASR